MRLFRDWEVKKTLGSGSFGTVYEVENTDPLRVGERAAIKKIVIPKDESEIEALRKALSKEKIALVQPPVGHGGGGHRGDQPRRRKGEKGGAAKRVE